MTFRLVCASIFHNKEMNTAFLLNAQIEDAMLPPEQLPIDLCITSPPYNLDIAYDTHIDNTTYASYLHWCEEWMKKLFGWMAEDGRVCINVPMKVTPPQDRTNNYPVAADYIKLMQKVGFHFYNQIVWDKGIMPGKTCWGSAESASSPDLRDPAECILIFYKTQWAKLEKDPGKGKSNIGKDFYKWTTNVWQFGAEKKKNVGGHPAAYPLDLPTRCIRLFSYKNDMVLDPFMGSGTTGEAAMAEGRNFIGIEMSKKYFDFAQARIGGAALQYNANRMVLDIESQATNATPKKESA